MALLFVFHFLLLFLLFFSVIVHTDLCVKYCYFYCFSVIIVILFIHFFSCVNVCLWIGRNIVWTHQNQNGSQTPNPANEHNFFIHSSVDRYLDCFHVLAIVNSASVNIGIHVSFSVTIFSGYSGIVGSYGHIDFIPSFLRNLHTVLHNDYITFPSIIQEGFLFSIASPAFIICRFFW